MTNELKGELSMWQLLELVFGTARGQARAERGGIMLRTLQLLGGCWALIVLVCVLSAVQWQDVILPRIAALATPEKAETLLTCHGSKGFQCRAFF